MLESISARWPDVERISDQPNDTSKVIDTYNVHVCDLKQNKSTFS